MIIQGRYDAYKPMIQQMRFEAFAMPWDGKESSIARGMYKRYFKALTDSEAMVCIILTFDVGYHNCGWWKNSLYDRCLHLSISMSNDGRTPAEATQEEIKAWVELIFGDTHPDALKWIWHEPGYKDKAINHYRLFYSKLTNEPILPEGEVYKLVPYDDGTSPEKVFNKCGG
jgi:hypothetical protein